ncbi:DUF2019 domain-containing protein [Aquabacter spiritensis]|uniref:DUF2019 domain-containing protein n=1 Tax=Aquabacter spiritensis TaxID=933073 RepID=UPI001047D4B1|nr:DUF2019 domain-containing protein [Aquabacter spiritensis]
MKNNQCSQMTEAEIFDEFRTITEIQKEAAEKNKNSVYKKICARVVELTQDLKDRPGDRRSVLLPLLEHENIQVRLMAANETLAVAPEAAQRTLQEIRDSGWYPFALDAGMTLSAFRSGRFRPE